MKVIVSRTNFVQYSGLVKCIRVLEELFDDMRKSLGDESVLPEEVLQSGDPRREFKIDLLHRRVHSAERAFRHHFSLVLITFNGYCC